MKPILLIKTTTTSLDKRVIEKQVNTELYVDRPNNVRDFLTVNIVYRGKRFDRAYKDKRTMDLETGRYFDGYHKVDIDKKEALSIVAEWEALPVKEIRKQLIHTTVIEQSYLS